MKSVFVSRFFVVALISSTLSVPAFAQEWSQAQQEVWEFEQACWKNQTPDFVDKCFHPNFQGWGIDSTVPTNKADRDVMAARTRATEENVYLFLKPIAITVHGDMATALYIATTAYRNKDTGEETTYTERWTDVLVREGGSWLWIADHGVDISPD